MTITDISRLVYLFILFFKYLKFEAEVVICNKSILQYIYFIFNHYAVSRASICVLTKI